MAKEEKEEEEAEEKMRDIRDVQYDDERGRRQCDCSLAHSSQDMLHAVAPATVTRLSKTAGDPDCAICPYLKVHTYPRNCCREDNLDCM